MTPAERHVRRHHRPLGARRKKATERPAWVKPAAQTVRDSYMSRTRGGPVPPSRDPSAERERAKEPIARPMGRGKGDGGSTSYRLAATSRR
jgi:hypothetical protein